MSDEPVMGASTSRRLGSALRTFDASVRMKMACRVRQGGEEGARVSNRSRCLTFSDP